MVAVWTHGASNTRWPLLIQVMPETLLMSSLAGSQSLFPHSASLFSTPCTGLGASCATTQCMALHAFLSCTPWPPCQARRLRSVSAPRSTSSASRLLVSRGMVMTGAAISTSISSRNPTPLRLAPELAAAAPGADS